MNALNGNLRFIYVSTTKVFVRYKTVVVLWLSHSATANFSNSPPTPPKPSWVCKDIQALPQLQGIWCTLISAEQRNHPHLQTTLCLNSSQSEVLTDSFCFGYIASPSCSVPIPVVTPKSPCIWIMCIGRGLDEDAKLAVCFWMSNRCSCFICRLLCEHWMPPAL